MIAHLGSHPGGARRTLLLGSIVAALLAGSAAAQRLSDETPLYASDGAASDRFGWDVGITDLGDRAVVSAVGDDDLGSSSGSAYVTKRVGGVWMEEQKLLPADGATNDFFAQSVAIDGAGQRIVVGSFFDDDLGPSSGAAYVFVRSGTSWSQEAKLLAADGQASDEFGSGVCLAGTGDRLIVGGPKEDTSGSNAGAAYVFVRSGTSWTQEVKLVPFDLAGGDEMGDSVTLDANADRAIVGASGHDAAATNAGAVYVFRRSGTNWLPEQKLTAADASTGDFFGEATSVSAAGDVLLIGAEGDNNLGPNSGSAYVFRRSGTAWTQEAKFLAPDGAGADFLGGSVSLSGDAAWALVGARGQNSDSGAAYLWYAAGGGSWGFGRKIVRSGGSTGDLFAGALSMDATGATAAIGASRSSDLAGAAGALSVLETSPLEVPAEYAGVQSAIDAAIFADEVLVAPGTWVGAIDMSGKEIVLRSSGGPGATTLQGAGGTVVMADSGEGPGALVEGFTITGGTGDFGAGMRIAGGASLTVRDCILTGNSNANRGGGLEIDQGSSPTIEDCALVGNSSGRGGGLSIGPSSTPVLRRCTIGGNSAVLFGAGVYVGLNADATLASCTIENNTCLGGEGGGVLFDPGSTGTLASCAIAGNQAGIGGGVRVLLTADPRIVNCTVYANTAVTNVGGIASTDGPATVENSIVRGNSHAGGMLAGSQIVDLAGPVATVRYSNVEGGWTGAGTQNVDVDPVFVDGPGGDLRLSVYSPNIDAGDSAALPPGLDLEDVAGLPRLVDDPFTPDTGIGGPPMVDLGAHELDPPCDSGRGPVAYCTAKLNSLACLPQITATGTPSMTDPNPFDVDVVNVLNFKNGLLFYGLNGRTAAPFLGGTLCVTPPLRRTTIQNSGGNMTPPDDCSGVLTFDFNAWAQAGLDAFLAPGVVVNGQYWTRDPADAFSAGLSDAIEFPVCP